MKDVVVLRQTDSINIEFTIMENHAISKKILEIGMFLSSQNIDILYDAEVEELLHNQREFGILE